MARYAIGLFLVVFYLGLFCSFPLVMLPLTIGLIMVAVGITTYAYGLGMILTALGIGVE